MNIKITSNWLADYLETDANSYEIQKYLSLCGPSVENVIKKENDYVFDIEITSNRIDAASVFGIAQECAAILPQFGKKARLKYNPFTSFAVKKQKVINKQHTLTISNNEKLCSRFSAIVLSNIVIHQSPDFTRRRLEMVGIRSINSVVDISNYLMIALGQPVHIFDYDTIASHTMSVRLSKKGETITTLDAKTFHLEGDEVIIVDGNGELIDLPGIMGGLNSAVTSQTKNIVMLSAVFNKEHIRKTSMRLGQRSAAAAYFEKGLDEERTLPTLNYGVELLQQHTHATPASRVYDLYPHPYTPRTIEINHMYIERIMGVAVQEKQVVAILTNLGFGVAAQTHQYRITVPSHRKNDVVIKEDIIEEITRIYGYFNLPSCIQKTDMPIKDEAAEKIIRYEQIVKQLLKNWGGNEMYNYSMIAEQQIKQLDLDAAAHLKLKNALSQDFAYMRTSLVPSLLKNISDNEPFTDHYTFFELANIYIKKINNLPQEVKTVVIASNADFFYLKGIIQSLFDELHIENIRFTPQSTIPFLSPDIQAAIGDIGWIGKLSNAYQIKHAIKKPVYLVQLNFHKLVSYIKPFVRYKPINPYAVIALDLTISHKEKTYFQDIADIIAQTQPLDRSIRKTVELIDKYENKSRNRDRFTLRFHFSSLDRNITLTEAKKELGNIEKNLRR